MTSLFPVETTSTNLLEPKLQSILSDSPKAKPKKPPPLGLLTPSKDQQTHPISLQCTELYQPIGHPIVLGLPTRDLVPSPSKDFVNDSKSQHDPIFSNFIKLEGEDLDLNTALDNTSDLFPFVNTLSPSEDGIQNLMVSPRSNDETDSLTLSSGSSLSTPLLDTSSTNNGLPFLEGLDLDLLLAGPMYDDVGDRTSWEPLFCESTSGLPLDTKLAGNKRSASGMKTEEESQSSNKRLKRDDSAEVEEHTDESSSSTSLPPIIVDSSDPKALRRARNTASARRSRDKKREKLSELEARVAELELLNTQLSVENEFLRNLKQLPPRP